MVPYLVLVVAIQVAVFLQKAEGNHPPKFILDGESEILLQLREGPDTPIGSVIYSLRGEDPDGDSLQFGISGSEDVVVIEATSPTEANVLLNSELDREIKDEYTIILTLTDGKLGDGNFITQSMIILVVDVNDNEPVFKSYNSSITVREDSSPREITYVEAVDRDEGPFGHVVYELQEPDGSSGKFAIRTVNGKGVLTLIGSLDYEEKNLYQLQVLAKDQPSFGRRNTGTAAIVVKVEDVEDQPPEFVKVPSVTRIPENLPQGSLVLQVKAVDGDRGVNNRISYSLLGGGRGQFVVHPDTGHVFVQGQLDREADDVSDAYILQIEAQEVNSTVSPLPSVITEVTVILVDVNDETPTFHSAAYDAQIMEHAQIGVPVTFTHGIPEIKDLDQGKNGTFQIYLEGDQGMFEVTPSIGINEVAFLIRVKDSSMLDFEKTKRMSFKVVAREMVSVNPKSSSAAVTVNILDTNDNVPEFLANEYVASVPENAVAGTAVATIKATDSDSGLLGTDGIRYTEIRGPITDWLHLNSVTGVITVITSNHGFDREQVTQYYLTIEARDNNGTGNRNTVQLILMVDDVNDNAPEFLQSVYEAWLLENEPDFVNKLIIKATDRDLNGTANSAITYTFSDPTWNDTFRLDEENGHVTLVNPVDFEALDGEGDVRVLNMTLRAQDKGVPSLYSEAKLVVYVQDSNDNSPKFDSPVYGATLSEDAASGSLVLRVKATDADRSSAFGKVVYRIQSGAQDKFVIDSETGSIMVAPGASLDPDLTNPKTTQYLLDVAALDGGVRDNQRTAVVRVNITVVDVNNKVPELKDPGTVFVKEDTDPGQDVTQLIALDPDSSARLVYAIDVTRSEARNEEGALIKNAEYNYADIFDVESSSGTVRLVRSVDREEVETIKLCVVVQDLAAEMGIQTATGTLTVKVEDVNDNSPVFRKPVYRKAVTENAQIGTPILTVVADDADQNRTILYTLQGSPEVTSLLNLEPETGEITVDKKIDREIFSWLNFSILATDNGVPPMATVVEATIQILDENDNNPVFLPDIANFSVPEDAAPGTQIGVIEATDVDEGDNGKVTYILDKKTSLGKFAIDPDTGVLRVAEQLDRETQDHYGLIVEAWDNFRFGFSTGESRNSFKQIFVRVLDVNDEIPVISTSEGCVHVTEYHRVRDTITSLRASDKDDPSLPNSKVGFSIVDGDPNGLFAIETLGRSSGRLFAARSLLQQVNNYTLTVKAMDEGAPSLHSSAVVNICVSDFNDNAPRFIHPSQNVSLKIPEDAPIGTVVVDVNAEDDDTGVNGIVRYRIKEDSFGHWRTFAIDQFNGSVTLAQVLDRERQKIYQIRVEAFDLGVPTPLSSDLDLMIYVKNVNDVEPFFEKNSLEIHFKENETVGTEKILLPSTVDSEEYDEEERKNSVCYFIIKGNENSLFFLDPFTHELSTVQPLDREMKASHELTVQSTENCAEPPQQKSPKSALHITVLVDDINDNAPRFVYREFTGGVTTEAQFGTKVMQVKATDADEGYNAKLSYHIVSDVRKSLAEGIDAIGYRPFVVNQTSGEVILNFDPQKGMKGYFNFDILVNDTGGLEDRATVYIYLLRADQRVKFIVRLTPEEVREKIDDFREVLGNITKAIVNVDVYKYHSHSDGTVDKTKSDIYAHFVQKNDNTIMEVATVLKLIDDNMLFLNALFKDLNVIDSQSAEAELWMNESEDLLHAWLIGLSVFLGAMHILVISICLTQRNRYERKLKAATATAFGSQDSGLNRMDVPNTNQHSIEGSNPIWMHSYENEWYKDEDSISGRSNNNSLDENAVDLINKTTSEATTVLQHEIEALKHQNNLNQNYQRNIYESVGKIITPLMTKLETTEL